MNNASDPDGPALVIGWGVNVMSAILSGIDGPSDREPRCACDEDIPDAASRAGI